MRRVVTFTVVASAWLAALAPGALPPRGQPLPFAERMEQIIHLGLFPDKPRGMSFREYFGNFTDINENLTKALERLEFGILDSENLEIAVKLAEDARRYKELAAAAAAPSGRRGQYDEIFNYKHFSWTWTMDRRQKIFQFMQHSVYSSRYEIHKLHNLRRKYNRSAVFQIGILYGTNLEVKTTAAALFSTMQSMPPNVTMLWYVFHYTKLLNMAYDVSSNVEHAYLLNQRVKGGFQVLGALKQLGPNYTIPDDSNEDS